MIPFKLHHCSESLSLSAPHFPSIQSHLICAKKRNEHTEPKFTHYFCTDRIIKLWIIVCSINKKRCEA